MSKDVRISLVIRTEDQLDKTVLRRYRAETDCELDVHFVGPSENGYDWALHGSRGDFIHFTHDLLEPHPGWWQAAIAACNGDFVPAPVIWRMDGTCEPPVAMDWGLYAHSSVPFLSRLQLRDAGPPQPGDGQTWPQLPTALRSDYAFTLHDRDRQPR